MKVPKKRCVFTVGRFSRRGLRVPLELVCGLKTAEVIEKEHAHCSDTFCEQWETEPKEVLCNAG